MLREEKTEMQDRCCRLDRDHRNMTQRLSAQAGERNLGISGIRLGQLKIFGLICTAYCDEPIGRGVS